MQMERKYIGLHESWHDMNPLLKDEASTNFSEDEANRRIDIIGQNGNDGLHYDDKKLDKDLFGNPLHNDNGC